jgi:hypothetical protein
MNPKTTSPSANAMKMSACDPISGFSLIAPMAAAPTWEMAYPAANAPKLNATAAEITTHIKSLPDTFAGADPVPVSAANNGGVKMKADSTNSMKVMKNDNTGRF